MEEERKATLFGFFVWFLAILYFFYEFLLRIFLGSIATDLIQDLHLTIEQFSIVGSAYYITYGIMQVPVGLLADRFGVRSILTFGALFCTLGVLVFSLSNGVTTAFAGRLMIGFGSSFAFVSLLILTLNWFPKSQFTVLAGVAQMVGALGPMMAGAPMVYLYHNMDNNWRLIFYYLAIIGALLTLAIFLFVRTKPKGKKNAMVFLQPHESLSSKLKTLLRIKQVWWIFLYSGCIYVAMPLLAAYWGTTYLQVRGFSQSYAAFIISMIWIGFAVGAPLVGKLSEKSRKRKPWLILTALIGVFSSAMILILPTTNELFLIALFTALGFACSGQSLAFAVMSENVPDKLNSFAMGLNNSALTLFGAFVPPLATIIIQKGTTGDVYTEAAFERGLALMPALFTLSLIFAIVGVRETYCRQQMAMHKIKVK